MIDPLIADDLKILWRAREAVSTLHATKYFLPKDNNRGVIEVLERMEKEIQDCLTHVRFKREGW